MSRTPPPPLGRIDLSPSTEDRIKDGILATIWGTTAWSNLRVHFEVRVLPAEDHMRVLLTVLELESWGIAPKDRDPAAPLRYITPTLLASFPVSDLVAHVHMWLINDGVPIGPGSEVVDLDAWDALRSRILSSGARGIEGPSRGRAPVRTPEWTLDLAETYLCIASTGSPSPRTQLAEQYGLTPSAAGNAVQKAKEHGWLGLVGKGSRRPIPGPKLIELWNEVGWPDWYSNTRETTEGKA